MFSRHARRTVYNGEEMKVEFFRYFNWVKCEYQGDGWEGEEKVEVTEIHILGHNVHPDALPPELIKDIELLAPDCEREWE